MSTITYKSDIVAWANEQAQLLRNKQFNLLVIEHLAEEIADVGKSEQREFESRMAVLIMHLIKWHYQPSHRGKSWERTIKLQRTMLNRRLSKTPSLKTELKNQIFGQIPGLMQSCPLKKKPVCLIYSLIPVLGILNRLLILIFGRIK